MDGEELAVDDLARRYVGPDVAGTYEGEGDRLPGLIAREVALGVGDQVAEGALAGGVVSFADGRSR